MSFNFAGIRIYNYDENEAKSVSLPDYSGNIAVHSYPTGNCQIFSIAYANYILDNVNEKDIEAAFAYIAYKVGANSPQMLIDVKARFLPVLERVFKPEQFVIKQAYTSTNESKMLLCLIKINYSVLKERNLIK